MNDLGVPTQSTQYYTFLAQHLLYWNYFFDLLFLFLFSVCNYEYTLYENVVIRKRMLNILTQRFTERQTRPRHDW